MSASRYIGRIGGLAVALGVGTAIVTGTGVAYAETGENEGDPGTSTNQPTDGQGESPTTGGAPALSAGPVRKRPSLLSVLDDVRSAIESSRSSSASESKPSTSSAEAGTVVATGGATVRKTPRRGEFGARDFAERRVVQKPAIDSEDQDATQVETLSTQTSTPTNTAAPQVLSKVQQRIEAATEWLASPRALAGRTNPVAPVAALSILGGIQQESPVAQVLRTPLAPQAQLRGVGFLTNLAGLLSPNAGTSPTAPAPVSPASWVLLAASRREFGTQAVVPAPYLDQGVITGCMVSSCSTSADGVTYTVLSGPANGGKVYIDPTTGKYSFLPFAAEDGTFTTSDTFTVLVSKPSALATKLTSIPIIGAVVFQPLINQLQQVPILGHILAPVLGQSITQTININVASFTGGAPIAFTTMVTSQVDQTQISVNYFPKIGLAAGGEAATILNGPGLGSAGNIDPNSEWGIQGVTPGLAPMRVKYNVVTWDPRGEFASGGVLQLDSPQFEGRDVMSIIDWVAEQPTTSFEDAAETDPYLGMVGGSYGGGIQLVTAPLDNRIDAIAPAIAWHTLPDSLYPNEAFKTSMSTLLLLDLVTAGARINPEIYAGIITGATLGVLTQSQIDLLARSTPDVAAINIPTLYIQGTVDVLFPLEQAMLNAQIQQLANPAVPIKMLWFCGGHGICLDRINPQQDAIVLNSTMAWMDAYVLGTVPDTLPTFQWVDQDGNFYTANVLPSQSTFNGVDYTNPTYTSGQVLPIMPRGGSGPQTMVPLPYSIAFGAEARNAVNIPVKNPAQATYIVGAPTVTIKYKGVGTSSHIYVQLVDTTTHKVVGNIVSPINVTLDGTDRTITMDMEAIAYTLGPTSTLELQVVTSATPYEDFVQAGVIQIQSVSLALPTISSSVTVTPVNAVPNSVLASL